MLINLKNGQFPTWFEQTAARSSDINYTTWPSKYTCVYIPVSKVASVGVATYVSYEHLMKTLAI